MGKLGGYLLLMRPANCLMMGFAVVVGATLSNPNILIDFWLNLVYGFVTGFMLTAASMAINDYYDREIDAINEPNRPIPSGLIKPKQALAFALVLTIIGFIASFLTNELCLVISIIAWVIFSIYTTVGKRSGLLGNFLVSTCVAIPLIYGSATILNTIDLKVSLFALMAFLSDTGREITKGNWSLCRVDSVGDFSNTNIIASIWTLGENRLLTVVNYSPYAAKGHVKVDNIDYGSADWSFTDLIAQDMFVYEGENLSTHGLYVELQAWKGHLFEVKKVI